MRVCMTAGPLLAQALELLRSRDYLPDLVLLDVQMPNRTGYEVPLRRERGEGLRGQGETGPATRCAAAYVYGRRLHVWPPPMYMYGLYGCPRGPASRCGCGLSSDVWYLSELVISRVSDQSGLSSDVWFVQ